MLSKLFGCIQETTYKKAGRNFFAQLFLAVCAMPAIAADPMAGVCFRGFASNTNEEICAHRHEAQGQKKLVIKPKGTGCAAPWIDDPLHAGYCIAKWQVMPINKTGG